MVPPLPADARAMIGRDLPDWAMAEGRDAIVRVWRFPDFSAAWGFMARVALVAERLDHHPEWSNVYGRVTIVLTTHDAGGLSARDITMARAIDALTPRPDPA